MDSSSSESDDTIDLGVLEEYVAQTLPSVSAKTKSDIVTTLLKIGVVTPADLQYVNEEDFNSEKLKLVQVRKLMKEWNKGTFNMFLLDVIGLYQYNFCHVWACNGRECQSMS